MTARTPLMQAFRQALRLADAASRPGAMPLDEIAGRQMDRRAFLRGAAGAAAVGLVSACGVAPTAALGRTATRPGTLSRSGGKVVIVGGGLAGLAAAHALDKAGVAFTLYEGSERAGGRVRSAHGLFGTGLSTELGAEFIDTSHRRMLALARELGLPLVDTAVPSKLADTTMVGGQRYDDQALARAVQPYLARFAHDQKALGDHVDYHHVGAWAAIDAISIDAYLDRIGMSGWLRTYVASAYKTEFGLEIGEQSAINLVGLVGTVLEADGWDVIGSSDERFKLQGGNQRLPDALARRHAANVQLGHKLAAIAPAGSGYRLSFTRDHGPTVDVTADVVIMALPFSTLRDVQITVPLPTAKRRAIQELGMGTNAKLIAGFNRRVWADHGYSGAYVADALLPNGWDSSYLQGGEAGTLTLYMGGKLGVSLAQGTAESQVASRLDQLEAIFPGAKAAYLGQAERVDWPGNPWARGSYACYKPGQIAAFGGAQAEPVGSMFFAGEHCAVDNQGFMEGAVQTGQAAAAAALKLFA